MPFDLEAFEYHAYRRQHEAAARELMGLLRELDINYGTVGQHFSARASCEVAENEITEHFLTRVVSSIACLFSDTSFRLSPSGCEQLLNWHRWVSTLFAASPMRNADSILMSLNANGYGPSKPFQIASQDLEKFCVLYSPESHLPLDLDALWQANRILAAGLCLSLLSPRFMGSPAAHGKREMILPWLAEKLNEIDDLSTLPIGILHDVYMHCSYADRPDKHDVKSSINGLISKKLGEGGYFALEAPPALVFDQKPIMLVVLEWFTSTHSIFRTHSRTLEAARARFHTIGLGRRDVDDAGRAVFDEFAELTDGPMFEQLTFIRNLAKERGVHVLYMPSVGMHPLTMYLVNLRLAPLQVVALGHPATTRSMEIDMVVVESDYVGDAACFSEELLLLPPDGMPYRASAAAVDLPAYARSNDPARVVNIIVAATTMKLNPRFLATCARIINESIHTVHFHFLVGQAIGLIYPQVVRVTRQFLGDHATVHPHQPYDQYMKVIQSADLFINPFPFGNTNGIIDTVTAGLVGVCMTGREVHEHIDEGLFVRLGFPSWLVAHTVEEYVAATLRLINDGEERKRLQAELTGSRHIKKLFKGRPDVLGNLLYNSLMKKLTSLKPLVSL